MVTAPTSRRYRLTAFLAAMLLAGAGVVAGVAPASAATERVAASTVGPMAVVPGSEVDLQVVVAGPATALGGSAFTYTVQVSNNSLPDADGATFSIVMPFNATNVSATCVAAAGAGCPADLAVSGFGNGVTGTMGALPHLGSATITVTGNHPVGVTSTTVSATVTAPVGTTDPDLVSNSSSVGTSLSVPLADVSTTITPSQTTVADGDTVTFTMTYANAGPNSANGGFINTSIYLTADFVNAYDAAIAFVSCTSAGGAVCPTDLPAAGGNNSFYGSETPTFPSGGSLVVVYQTTFTAKAVSCGDDASFIFSSHVYPPRGTSDPFPFDNQTGSFAVSAEIDPCPSTDLTASKSGVNLTSPQSGTIQTGDVVRYTMSYSNAGPVDADGARIQDSFGGNGQSVYAPAGVFVSCESSGGAVCPDSFPDFTPNDDSYPDSLYSVRVPVFPAGGTVTVTYDITFAAPAVAGCGTDVNFNNVAGISTPSGLIDSNPQNNNDSVYLGAEPKACVPVQMSVEKTQSQDTIRPGDVVTYTITYSNIGTTDAHGAKITDRTIWYGEGAYAIYDRYAAHLVSCAPTGGAVCPDTLTDVQGNTDSGYFFMTTIPTFPAASTITITYDVTFPAAPRAGTCDSSLQFLNVAEITAPAGAVFTGGNGASQVIADAGTCADVAVNKSVSPSSVRAGEPVSYTIDVSNSSPNTADSVAVTDPLPTGFVFGSATCTVPTGTAVCGAVDYDPSTRTMTSTVDSLASGDTVRIVLTGTAGVQAGTFTNTATAAPTPGVSRYVDPNPVTNFSQVNLQIFNTVSPITVTKTIAGLPASDLTAPLTFTGTITCETQGTKPWTATVPAGASSGVAAPVSFWDGEGCVIAEDAPPTAPAWTAWSGSPVIAPAVIPVLGQATPVAVSVTNTLVGVPRGNGVVLVTKAIAGLTVAGLPEPLTFTGSVVCGTQPAQSWAVTIPAGSSSGNASPLTYTEGDPCTVTEDAVTAVAPAGYVWSGAPLITPETSGVLVDGEPLDVTVTNTLDAVIPTGAIEVSKVVSGAQAFTGDFGFAVFCGDAGTYAAVVSLDSATTGSTTVLNVPVDAHCTITENSRANAPTGLEWAAPTYSATSLTISADAVSSVTVTNPLSTAPTHNPHGPVAPPGGLASTGSPMMPALSAALLLLAVGTAIVVVRRRRATL